FSYPDQFNFPPVGNYGNFDLEAMFWHQDSLHLFSKDRSDPSTGYTKHYTLPTQSGTYVANLVDSFQTNHPSFFLAITAADINEDESEVVLLSADKIWLFSNFAGTNYFGGDVAVLDLSVFSQKEGICYRNGFLYITDEESFGLGGKISRINTGLFVSIKEEPKEQSPLVIYNSDFRLERVVLSNSTEVEWQLFSTEGRLVQSGSALGAIGRNDLINQTGVYVLQISENGTPTSATIIRL
ncbi:MAG: T9SS type A sorting domain-containing protein, partial [Flavobacteriales bacterium]